MDFGHGMRDQDLEHCFKQFPRGKSDKARTHKPKYSSGYTQRSRQTYTMLEATRQEEAGQDVN